MQEIGTAPEAASKPF